MKQYVVPLFQRSYSWNKKEWLTLWEDLKELYDSENPRQHFMGSIVTIPAKSVPEGVAKFLLIDGQQRITTKLSIVSIVLDATDNPYLVFESLNHKGKPLSVADLLRNYVFMNIHVDHQEDIYNDIWKSMQDRLGDTIPKFVRHYFTISEDCINTGDVYNVLKERIDTVGVEECLKELEKYSKFYSIYLNPEKEKNEKIRKELLILKRLDISTSNTLLLNLYDFYSEGNISADEFEGMLCVIENYIIRRFYAVFLQIS